MKSWWTRITLALTALAVIILFGGVVAGFFKHKTKTETALAHSLTEDITFNGVYLRDETVIYSAGNGVISYEHEDGSRVGKSSVIARRFKSESDIRYRREIEQLEEQIAVLREAEKLIGTDTAQLETVTNEINEAHFAVASAAAAGDYSGVQDKKNALLKALCKREIAKGESSGYDERIRVLENRISELEALANDETQIIYADGSGYFVSGVDGYEGSFGYSDIEGLTAEKIKKAIAEPDISNSGSEIGKLVADFHWRMAAVLDESRMRGYYEGSTVKLITGSGNDMLQAEIISIASNGDGTGIYVFQCDTMNASVAGSRVGQFKLLFDSYGGLRVPKSAIREDENQQRGVYVAVGGTMHFRKIDVTYWGEDYVICAQKPADEEGWLRLYDRVIVEGKELYDGKVVE